MRQPPPLTQPPLFEEARRPGQPRLLALQGGAAAPARRTLDDVLTTAWSALSTGETAACPVCAEPMTPRWSAGAGAVGGRCGACATTLD